MSLNDKIKRIIRDWLNVRESNINSVIIIDETDDFKVNAIKNEIWYRGKPDELHQFYTQYHNEVINSMFWHGKSTTGVDFVKKHTGIPSLIVDKLVDIVVDDMNDIKVFSDLKDNKGNPIANVEAQARWDAIEEEHDFKDSILKDAVREMLLGDCALKISYDADISEYPIIEVIPGRDIEFEYSRGRIVGIKFYFPKEINKKYYVLEEHYQQSGVTYKLYDENGRDVSVGMLEDMYGLYPFEYDGKFIMAIPLMLSKSKKYEGRGKSIFDGKEDAFDSLDEAWSQWMDALRDGRTRTYIPENIIPRDPSTGKILRPSTFDHRYIETGSDMRENAKSQVQVETPDIKSESYLATYITALDLALQGLISPSTLGIDVKKLDNAEAQREKEKTTLYTRGKIVSKLEKVIPKLVSLVLTVDDMLKDKDIGSYNVNVDFGEYANPSFEAQVETVGKAKQQGIMSTEKAVDELYGDTMTDDEKLEEINRIKLEQGIPVEEPAVNEFDTTKELESDVTDGEQEEV